MENIYLTVFKSTNDKKLRNFQYKYIGTELQCLSYVLIFQHLTFNAYLIARIDAVVLVKDVIVIYRKNETILILINLKCHFSHPENQYLS